MTNRTLRTFLALPLDPEVAARMEAAARARLEGPDAPRSRWRVVPAGRLHLTLKFLGATDPALGPRIREALRRAGRAILPGEGFRFEGWRLLPHERRPGVLALTVSDPAGTLSGAARILEEETAALGFPREDRAFLPHVTVARARHRVQSGRMAGDRIPGIGAGVPGPASFPPEAAWSPDRLAWFESRNGPGGLEYRVLAEAAVGRAEGAEAVGAMESNHGFQQRAVPQRESRERDSRERDSREREFRRGRDGRSSSVRES